MQLPDYVLRCLETLKKQNIEAYLVGGCVRDMLLSKTPHDFDMTVNCPPETIQSIFPKTIDTGLKHGTVSVVIDSHLVEITQMRKDGAYSDHRRPDCYYPAQNIHADLKRRDFTINAMAMDASGAIIDDFDGRGDLAKGVIRAVGDATVRFEEDALRILRAFRFASQLAFVIEPATLSAALQKQSLLQNISVERIFSELVKCVTGQNPQSLEPLLKSGGLAFLGLEFCRPLAPLTRLPDVREVRFAAFLQLCGSDPRAVCTALKTDKRLLKQCVFIAQKLNAGLTLNKETVKKIVFESDFQTARYLLLLYDVLQNRAFPFPEEIQNEPIFLKDLAVNGRDMQALGIEPTRISTVLRALCERVHQNPKLNQKQILLQLAQSGIEK